LTATADSLKMALKGSFDAFESIFESKFSFLVNCYLEVIIRDKILVILIGCYMIQIILRK